MSGKKGKGKQTWFGMTLAAAVLSGCGQSPMIMPAAKLPVQGMQASKAFEFDNLSAHDKDVVKLALAAKVAGFTPSKITGNYLRLGFHFKAEGTGPDGKAMTVTGKSFPDGLSLISVNGKALPQVPAELQAALDKKFKGLSFSTVTVTSIKPAQPRSAVLGFTAEVYETMNTRTGIRWSLMAVEGTFDQQANFLTITKLTLIKSGDDRFGF